jgi:hypothetical protein
MHIPGRFQLFIAILVEINETPHVSRVSGSMIHDLDMEL